MTTNKWTSTAGPKQTNDALRAINSLRLRGTEHIEISGVIGVSERRCTVCSSDVHPTGAATAAHDAIGEKHSWTITRENCRQIEADCKAAAAAIEIPVIDKRITQDEDREQRAKWAAMHAKRVADDLAREEATRAYVTKLRTEYPWAVGSDSTLSSHARAAKNLRTELNRNFPGVVFSVRSERYSGGSSIDVSWAGGPDDVDVMAVAEKYRGGRFNGMTDSYEYDQSAIGYAVEEVFGRVSYVQCRRERELTTA